jgi:hypothetical protein
LSRHRDGDEGISLAVLAGPALEEARDAGDAIRMRLCPQRAPDRGGSRFPSHVDNDILTN